MSPLKLLNTEGLFPGFPAQSKWLTVPPHDGFEVYEQIVVEFSTQRPRSAMDCPGRLVPEHHSVSQPRVVLDEEQPGLRDGLADVDDGRDHVGVEPVQMGGEPGPVGVDSASLSRSRCTAV